MNYEFYIWLGLLIVFIVFEMATTSLTTIWFAGGALVAFIMACFNAPWWSELIAFFVVSFLLLIFTRPILTKAVKMTPSKTNAEGLIGQKAKVVTEINNNLESGYAVVNGQDWTARADKDDVIIPKDEMVEIVGISGVKLIVKKIEN